MTSDREPRGYALDRLITLNDDFDKEIVKIKEYGVIAHAFICRSGIGENVFRLGLVLENEELINKERDAQ